MTARTWRVEAAHDGVRLDVALSDWLGEPRARAQRRIAAGEVTVDGSVAGKSQRLEPGQRIAVRAPAAAAPVAPPPAVPVRYEDDHLLVVAKPADLVVHHGAGVAHGTLVDALRATGVRLRGGDPERPGVVHRLDRGTSGLLAFAKTERAYTGLVEMLSRREVERRYWALVQGAPAQARATVEAPIARDPKRRTRYRADPEGKHAVTHFDVDEQLDEAARVTVSLETGRTHQIRVHMSAIGHPVVADALYGAAAGLARRAGLDRPALHAARLAFDHPVTGERVAVEEPLPDDLSHALAVLRGGR